jgi:hypothetical protein
MLTKFTKAIAAATSELHSDLHEQIEDVIEAELDTLHAVVRLSDDADLEPELLMCSWDGANLNEYGTYSLQDAIADELLSHTGRDPADVTTPDPKPVVDAMQRINEHLEAIVKEMLACREALKSESK